MVYEVATAPPWAPKATQVSIHTLLEGVGEVRRHTNGPWWDWDGGRETFCFIISSLALRIPDWRQPYWRQLGQQVGTSRVSTHAAATGWAFAEKAVQLALIRA